MGEVQGQIEQPPPFGEIPEAYVDPEGDAELQDPTLALESTEDMRRAWSDWFCSKGPGEFANVKFFGKGIGGVPAPAVDAYKALEAALMASGYQPSSAWANKCRKIAGKSSYSLHSYGVAIDIDAGRNPHAPGPPFSGKIQEVHVDAVLAIRNTKGRRIWLWGGVWGKPDRMHFQLDQGPKAVVVDPATVPGAVHIELEGVTHVVTATSLNMREEPARSGGLIAGLPEGARVAAQSDPTQQRDEYEWIRIEAVVGSRLLSGWVATKFLDGVGGVEGDQTMAVASAPALAGATHRVNATSLNLRDQPTTSGDIIVSLGTGTEVTVQLDAPQESDDYRWVKIKAAVAGGLEEGWVAGKYLEDVR